MMIAYFVKYLIIHISNSPQKAHRYADLWRSHLNLPKQAIAP
ncbi:hypothetical protein [Spirulina subsalsa]|nr:hypothetical protein [Spirulina subsalsa]